MKRTSLVLTAILAIACSGLHAQSLTTHASVPFDFWMGTTFMPAGPYEVRCSNSLLQFRDETQRDASGYVFAHSEYKLHPPKTTSLVFNRYGDTYFLAKVVSPRLEGGRILPTTLREKEILSRAQPDQSVMIALHRKQNSAK
jgi:hypothetical protein